MVRGKHGSGNSGALRHLSVLTGGNIVFSVTILEIPPL